MKKSSYLQTLYLQKPLLLVMLIAIVATLPWIGLGDFYTKGEPREASLAISMIEHGNWIIPYGFADEFAYKPPLNHWIIAGFSYLFNGGEVTPFISRLPSVLGFVGLIGVCFMFFARRRSTLEAFVACLIIITCFEIHRAAVTARLDMLLTFFMVTGLIQMFLWQDRKQNKFLFSSWIFLTLATLVKGPIGIVLPCTIFGIYLLLQRYNLLKTFGKCLLVGIPALIVPIVWYYLAYEIKGEEFFNLVFAENFGRFLRISNESLGIHYRLGVENPWWFYIPSLLAGFLPWTLLLVISLFFFKYKESYGSIKKVWSNWWSNLSKDKAQLFCLITIVVTLIFFTIPSSKRTVYVMPIYPFIALFMAQYILYLVQNKPKVIRIFTTILLIISSLIALFSILGLAHIINLSELGHFISKRDKTLYDIKLVSSAFESPTIIGIVVVFILLFALVNTTYLLRKHANVKILMASFGIMLSLNIFLDGCILPEIKNGYSSRPFAERISQKYNLRDHLYVINDLINYSNPYGLNFYLGNNFKNFKIEQPNEGYFLIGEPFADEVKSKYPNYSFVELEKQNCYTDYKLPIILYRIQKK